MSDGLGGHVGLSCSPGLGSAKRVTKNKTHILLFNILLVFLCKSYSFQVEVYQTTSGPSQLKTSYLDVKMLQSKTINHSFCKFKILLLILEDFPNSAQHNYTFVMVPNGRSSVTS